MQYKIPIQIENEDTIVAGLSLRQLGIIAVGGGLGYTVFNVLSQQVGSKVATVFAVIPVILFIIVALVKISEMTFLPAVLNFCRLHLNAKLRGWSLGTDSYSDLEIGYITPGAQTKEIKKNTSLESKMNEELSSNIGKL
ncbi:MAG: hypothetical protein HHAS10_11720 [Candidatus Altimarinota bacterium]